MVENQNIVQDQGRTNNAWLVQKSNEVVSKEFSVTVKLSSTMLEDIQIQDAFLIVEKRNEDLYVAAAAKIFRKRTTIGSTTFYFDGVVQFPENILLKDLGISASTASVSRLDWSLFEKALSVCKSNWQSFPVLNGSTPNQQAYLRDLLQDAVMDDLLGPADGPMEEIIGMSVRDRYLAGKLAPQNTIVEEDDDLSSTSGRADEEEANKEIDVSTNQSLVPSSMGFTFCVDASVESLELEARWGRYERTESERIDERTNNPFRCWRRIPSGGSIQISFKEKKMTPIAIDSHTPEVKVQGSISDPLPNGDRLVTIFLINGQTMPEQNQDQAWLFQPELIVRDPNKKAIFRRKPVFETDGSDNERESLEMIYRRQVEFAVGHGVSVHAITAEKEDELAVEIRTSVLPQYELPVTETPGIRDEDRPAMRQLVKDGYLDMERIASLEKQEFMSVLRVLINDYAKWINEQKSRIGKDVVGYDSAASTAMDRCSKILDRLNEGASVLETNQDALEAFRFINHAMALQRVHSVYSLSIRRGDTRDIASFNQPEHRSWRPFQLAFILLCVPSLADPTHKDRTEPLMAYADLLWFPTGGGKTEAYLGVAAFTMAIRRLQKNLGGLDGSRGLAVIMRYTLRLLTLQQFQRATTLICAMEVLRRTDKKWGNEPFTLGLWVGQRVTPNTTEESHTAVEKEREGKYGTGSTPAQLSSCPWCGSEIVPGRDINVKSLSRDIGKTIIYCGDKHGKCDFGRNKSKDLGLPVLVVDDEIYRRPPTMLIATVDKFAMMAWRGKVRTLFGRATHECERHGLLWPEAECTGNHQKKGSLPNTSVKQMTSLRPPDLIIQDEFHLISGPLGTMVGLYETAVDELSTWKVGDKIIRPKIIASTATVRKAEEQVNNVFLRQVSIFPPHGLDVEDNFFSIQRSINSKPGRRYLGICSPGSSRPAVLIRVYVAQLTAAQALFDRFGQAADPYMTLVGYFNSLRELGGMRRLAEDDVQTRAYRVQMSDVIRPGLAQRSIRNVDELTSRVANKDIPKKLDQLEVKFKSSWAKGEARAMDIVLASNMLSVGVDVSRLGIMVVNGQPKNTAEYIQATSRIGRIFPGLVCTVLTWARPRDLSHYETFEHYHATFYKHVEAQSVTPFAPRALDRGLTGIMVSLLRLGNDVLNPNLGANSLDSVSKPEVTTANQIISNRGWKTTNKKIVKQNVESMISDRIDRWVKEVSKVGRRIGYQTESRQGDVAALLKKPGALAWDEFTVPMSMREVEPGVRLIMDTSKLNDPPAWETRVVNNDAGGAV